jgi:ArsR family transcriptional regulator
MVGLLNNGKKKSVTEIYEALKMEQAVASHHLSILKDKGILINNRDGKKMLYSLKDKNLTGIIQFISNISN